VPDSIRFAARACLPLDLGSRPARRERYLKPIQASDGIVFFLSRQAVLYACGYLDFSMRAGSGWSCDRYQQMCVCVCVCVHLTAYVERRRSARAPDHRGADALVISQHWLGDDELIAEKKTLLMSQAA